MRRGSRIAIGLGVVLAWALSAPGRAQAPEVGYDHDAIEARRPSELATPPEPGDPFFEEGKALYLLHCAPCHGETGAADAPAAEFMRPRPRDFTAANFAFRTTRSGELSTDADLFRVISRGVPGTTMPAWGEGIFTLSERQRWQTVYYVKFLGELFWDEYSNPYREVEGDEPEPILDIGQPPERTEELLARGRDLYMDQELGGCARCHGEEGRGDGEAANEMFDELGEPARPNDLTNPWRNKNGMEVADIYRTLSSGISGTPMADFMDGIPEDQDRWALAYYSESLIEERSISEGAVHAVRVDGSLPDDPDDEAWERCEPFGVALMGQYVMAPRWQAPAVDYARLCALHDGREIAIRVEWNDPFEDTGAEPAPEEEPADLEEEEPADLEEEEPADLEEEEPADLEQEEPADLEQEEPTDLEQEEPTDLEQEEPAGLEQEEPADLEEEETGAVGTFISVSDMIARAAEERIPDRLVLSMPAGPREPGDAERPHMFMGDEQHPVHAWMWSAEEGGSFGEGRATGPAEQYEAQGAEAIQVTGQSRWLAGRWRVVFRRAMTTAETQADTQLGPSTLMPFTLRVWDGSAGERGLQSATSSWQYVYVEAPLPASAYVRGVLGMGIGYLLMGLGWWRIRRRRD